MTDENDDTRRGNNDSKAQEGDPLGLYVGIQAGETFDGNDVFAIYDLAGGDDRANYRGGDNAFLLGGSGDDFLMSNGDDFIMGGSGDDTIIAVGRESVIRGGSGNDAIKATLGNDWLTGDTGNDTIDASGGDDFIAGGDGNDLLYGRGGDDWIIGGPGDDRMSGGDGDDVFHMHPGDDNDTIFDFRGSEDILDLRALGTQFTWAELSARFTLADNGRDTVIDLSTWGGGTITLHNVKAAYLSQDMFWLPYPGFPAGELFEEVGFYVPGTAAFVGHPGDDPLVADGRADFIFGGEGDDMFSAGGGEDWILGGEGNDRLVGGGGDDFLMGGEGRDTLDGGANDDWLSGGTGTDTLTGGAGADTFAYFAGHGSDTITDFGDGKDVIDLSALETISGLEDLSVVQLGSFVTIDLHGHGGRTIALENFDIEDLDDTDFVFYQPPEPAQDSL